MPSFYTPQLKPEDTIITVEGDEYHHIAKVFRHREGDDITLNNGSGIIASATIDTISKRFLSVKITNHSIYDKKQPDIVVFFALLRNKNDYQLVEKLTELGVREFYPFMSERTVKATTSNTVEKFEKIAISAIKQCDNAWLPIFHQPLKLKELLNKYGNDKEGENNTLLLAAAERGADFSIQQCFPDILPHKIGVVIGPEGGFTDEEMNLLQVSGIFLVTLGKHILRAETAAICAVSQILLLVNSRVPDYY